MSGSATTLDHIGLCTADGPALWAAYERLGFSLTPIARQSGRRTPGAPVEPFGTGNRCAMLRRGYLELLALLDPGGFDNGLSRFLARYTGMHILALGMDDAAANLARLRRAGIPIAGVSPLERPVDDPKGPRARFERLPLPDAPEGRVQLIKHLTPELIWQERWLDHQNGAVALEEAVLASAEPAESAARLSRLAGLPLVPDPAGGFLLVLPDGTRVRMLSAASLDTVFPGLEPPSLPFLAGFVVRTGDGNAAATKILAGLPVRELAGGGGLMVPPSHAGGAALVFRA
jgi:hypothetical protein